MGGAGTLPWSQKERKSPGEGGKEASGDGEGPQKVGVVWGKSAGAEKSGERAGGMGVEVGRAGPTPWGGGTALLARAGLPKQEQRKQAGLRQPGQGLRAGETGEAGDQDGRRGGSCAPVLPPDPATSLRSRLLTTHTRHEGPFPTMPGAVPWEGPDLVTPSPLPLPSASCLQGCPCLQGRHRSLAGPRDTYLCTQESRWSEVTS